MGIVYLIHFDKPYKHANHYIGFVEEDLCRRLQEHLDNYGSKLLKAVNNANIQWEVVRVWEGVDRNFERKLKKRKNSKQMCPVCNKRYENICTMYW